MASTVIVSPSPGGAEQHTAAGKAARVVAPRRAFADWGPAADRPDPVAVLEAQARDRIAELMPIRYGRMLESPLAFFRGGAAIMAADLATAPRTGMRAQLCGDAVLSNFGGFASSGRDPVFDIDDFDETLPGPWEWDVLRLAASLAIAGRELGLTRRRRGEVVAASMASYHAAMRRFAGMSDLDVWYSRLEPRAAKEPTRAMSGLTERVDGRLRFVSRAPLVVPFEELLPASGHAAFEAQMREVLVEYRLSLRSDRRLLLGAYEYAHLARRVAGVGSVGTRAWVMLLTSRVTGDPLFLQLKEARSSVLEPYAGRPPVRHHGQRVVEGQWLMQASSDAFLGWLRSAGIDGTPRDYYVRRLWDRKVTAEPETMTASRLGAHAALCGWTLARAHARSGNRVAIGAYLGSGDVFDRAATAFAETYADCNERDHAALAAAAGAGRVTAQRGV